MFFKLLFAAWGAGEYLLLAAAALVVIVVIFYFFAERKRIKVKKFEDKTGVEYGTKERYSTTDEVTNKFDDTPNATYTKGDIIVAVDETLTAGKKQNLVPGKYTVLTSIEGVESFNVRINGLVREVKHNSVVILGEGDTICPVSHAIILR